jgi:hypothetical protein
MTSTNNNNENIEQQNVRYPVSPAALRYLNIAISDHYSTMVMYNGENMIEFYAKLGHLEAQRKGAVPFEGKYEGMKISTLPVSEKRDTPTTTAFFFGPRPQLRVIKQLLRTNCGLAHDPHAMNTDDPCICKFRVDDMTKDAAVKIRDANPTLITNLVFQSDLKEAKRTKSAHTIEVQSTFVIEDDTLQQILDI